MNLPPDGLVPYFSWVRPWLAGSARPARYMPWRAGEAWEAIAAVGVTCVVVLTEDAEDRARLQAVGLRLVHLPIPNARAAPDPQAVAWAIDAAIADGAITLVHCEAGVGRTGLVLAAFLARAEGLAPGAAIEAVRRLRPDSVENEAQRESVAAIAAARGRAT